MLGLSLGWLSDYIMPWRTPGFALFASGSMFVLAVFLIYRAVDKGEVL